MVYTAGIAKSQLIKPKPNEEERADTGEKPPSRKIWDE